MLVRQIADSTLAQFAYLIGCPRRARRSSSIPSATWIATSISRRAQTAHRRRGRYPHSCRLPLGPAGDGRARRDRVCVERGRPGVAVRVADPRRVSAPAARSSRSVLGRVRRIPAVHTPGHTPEHLSYLVRDVGGGAKDFIALASGDFVFVGDVGRPDLLERAAGMVGVMEPSARAQFCLHPARVPGLPEFLQVWPAHGAGSACGKSLGDVPTSTVGYELRTNRSIHAAADEQAFVDFILAGQPEPPLYFARMKRDNRRGPTLLAALPSPPSLHGCGSGGPGEPA